MQVCIYHTDIVCVTHGYLYLFDLYMIKYIGELRLCIGYLHLFDVYIIKYIGEPRLCIEFAIAKFFRSLHTTHYCEIARCRQRLTTYRLSCFWVVGYP